MKDSLKEKLKHISSKPGVYLMKNERGRVIYVGKAGNLKKRISSYFKPIEQLDIKTGVLVKKIHNFETTITATENEALILESTLIKKHRPRYNVILKDDKRYPSIRLDISQPYPTIEVIRKIKKDNALYFGPYASAYAVKQTINIINKAFKLRKCRTGNFMSRKRPCLNYQMGTCLAPCCIDVDVDEYKKIINEVIMLLKGRAPELIRKIKNEMYLASDMQEFEYAAQLRDRAFALERTMEKQVVVSSDLSDRDILAVKGQDEFSVITVLPVRSGYMMGARHYFFKDILVSDSELLFSFIRQYYEKGRFIPSEILLPSTIYDKKILEGWISSLKLKKVHLLTPQRGEKLRLVNMATKNANQALQEKIASKDSEKDLLLRLQKRLRLNRLPKRIECFDNSNISGTSPVAGMVVFENGKPAKRAYRRFKIKTVKGQDDYAYMAEILKRRFTGANAEESLPDILIVDGGKGQLNIAVAVLSALGMKNRFYLFGIAKKDTTRGETKDKIFQPQRSNPVKFGKDEDLLLFLQRIRDEAHRFAITFHRQRRNKKAIHSILDDIQGVGPGRKKLLLKHFGSIKKIRAASVEDIQKLPGINYVTAQKIVKALR
ncbi:MAG: excinuclease ABC subunit UvrC [Desulfobacterales bacterium]|nr:excinuclease ABC subunit UvrC [Desulfobacterales bacterium]